jgi:septum site-determining protein MinC
MRVSAVVDYAQAGELKFGQVGIANLRVRTLDVAQLAAEMRDRVQRAPNLFARAAVVLDFGGLSQVPAVDEARALLEGLRDAGVLPVALAYGTKEIDALSQQLGLPLLAKFRAQYEPASQAATPAPAPVEPAPAKAVSAPAPAKPATSASPGLMQTAPVRSGQQVYAEHRDLTVLSAVGAGAEAIADGSIHIYGALRGRALAGAQATKRPASSAASSMRSWSRWPGTTRCWKTSRRNCAASPCRSGWKRDNSSSRRWTDCSRHRPGLPGFTKQELDSRLRGNDGKKPEKANLAEIIVVTSGKGGVGKTTSSASIATGSPAAARRSRSSTSTSACATST